MANERNVGYKVSIFETQAIAKGSRADGRRKKIDGSRFQDESESQESPWRLLYN